MSRARYALISVTRDIVTIKDLSDINNPCVTITNDAEAVVRELVEKWGDKRIQYVDTMGRLDELLHDHGTFKGFGPVDKE